MLTPYRGRRAHRVDRHADGPRPLGLGWVAAQKFLGNSAASIMGGRSTLSFLDLPGEDYMPNIYAVGLFLGTMTMELADSCTITCQKFDLVTEIDFKFKVGSASWRWHGSASPLEAGSGCPPPPKKKHFGE